MSELHTEPAPTLDDVWRLFREYAQEAERRNKEEKERWSREEERWNKEEERRNKEAEQRSKEAEQRNKEAEQRSKEAEQRSQEMDRRFQEIERFLKEQSRETDRKIGKLTSRLGEFVEGLIAPALIRVFQARGIAVNGLSRDISRKNPQLNLATQIDLLAVNGDCCILVEVKSKLSIDDVNEHLERMEKFKRLFPEYADKQAYGAIAAMVTPETVAKYAYHKGFFVLAQQGETVAILNDENFKPVAW